jgi:hypothetical protein
MIPDNVTLIVKAPNQQIEDQNIECQSSWSVRQLKGHLSEIYPSKPVRKHLFLPLSDLSVPLAVPILKLNIISDFVDRNTY